MDCKQVSGRRSSNTKGIREGWTVNKCRVDCSSNTRGTREGWTVNKCRVDIVKTPQVLEKDGP